MRISALALFSILLAVAAPTGAVQTSEEALTRSHEYVRIGMRSLRPEVQVVSADAPLGWLNESSKIARVRFDPDVARKMVCLSPTSFSLDRTYLESRPIRSRGFASLCRLAPGEYTYQVELSYGAGGSIPFGETLEGRIIVQ